MTTRYLVLLGALVALSGFAAWEQWGWEDFDLTRSKHWETTANTCNGAVMGCSACYLLVCRKGGNT